MYMDFIDLLTLISYAALNVDLIFQIRRLKKTHSSEDISITGLVVRYLAILVILYKFIRLGDVALTIGQLLILLTVSVYFYFVLRYRGVKR